MTGIESENGCANAILSGLHVAFSLYPLYLLTTYFVSLGTVVSSILAATMLEDRPRSDAVTPNFGHSYIPLFILSSFKRR